MDLAVTLVKSVMRAFYATREILVIDALILHEAYGQSIAPASESNEY